MKSILYTYKFRIYPNSKQIDKLSKSFGCVRYVYNYFLNKETEEYKRVSSQISKDDLLLIHKITTSFLEDVLQKSIKKKDKSFNYKNNMLINFNLRFPMKAPRRRRRKQYFSFFCQ